MFPTSARPAICIQCLPCSSLIGLLTGVEGRLEDSNTVVLFTQVWSAVCCLLIFSLAPLSAWVDGRSVGDAVGLQKEL